eukprot:m.118509 g.118509  ORF g.118509 m.118509 type:complete len:1357 (-) comp16124_c0_seq3:1501-5571(-)
MQKQVTLRHFCPKCWSAWPQRLSLVHQPTCTHNIDEPVLAVLWQQPHSDEPERWVPVRHSPSDLAGKEPADPLSDAAEQFFFKCLASAADTSPLKREILKESIRRTVKRAKGQCTLQDLFKTIKPEHKDLTVLQLFETVRTCRFLQVNTTDWATASRHCVITSVTEGHFRRMTVCSSCWESSNHSLISEIFVERLGCKLCALCQHAWLPTTIKRSRTTGVWFKARPYPSAVYTNQPIQIGYCENIFKERPCRIDCPYAHSREELEVWEDEREEEEEGFALKDGRKTASQKSHLSFCEICEVWLDPEAVGLHNVSRRHRQKREIVRNCAEGFVYRRPPTGVELNYEYNLCFHKDKCPYGADACTHSHCQSELDEWNERRRLMRIGRRDLAERPPTRTSPPTYTAKMRRLLNSEIGEQELMLNKDGVNITTAETMTVFTGDKVTFVLKILSSSRHVLRQVGFLVPSSPFSFARICTVVLSPDCTPRHQMELKWRWADEHADVRESIGAVYNGWTGLEVFFGFSSAEPGTFRQWVIFDFGSMMIGRPLQVNVVEVAQRPAVTLLKVTEDDVLQAISANNVGPLLHWLSSSGPSDKRPLQCARFLHHAIFTGNTEALALLVKAGTPVDVVDSSDLSTGLHKAARFGQEKAVRLLLTLGASVNIQDKNGVTALHCAIMRGSFPIVTMLYRAGADASLTAKGSSVSCESMAVDAGFPVIAGFLRLQPAVAAGKQAAQAALAAYKASLEAANADASAITFTANDLALLEASLAGSEGAGDSSDKFSMKALAMALSPSDASSLLNQAVMDDRLLMVQTLAKENDPMQPGAGPGGRSAAQNAVLTNNLPVLKALALRPIQYFTPLEDEKCLFVEALENGLVDILEFMLLENGVRIQGEQLAVLGEKPAVIVTAAYIALCDGRISLRNTETSPAYLSLASLALSILCLLPRRSSPALCQELVAWCARGPASLEVHMTRLDHALNAGREEMCLLLLEKGMQWAQDAPAAKTVLLLGAVRHKMPALFRRMLSLGASITGLGVEGETVLHTAATFKSTIEFFQTLVDAGADCMIADLSGNTVAHAAVQNDRADVVALLMKLCPQIMEKKNNEGRTPADLARALNRDDILQQISFRGVEDLSQKMEWWTAAATNPQQTDLKAGVWFADAVFFEGLAFFCATSGNLHMVVELVSRGLNIHALNAEGQLLLHVAVANGHKNVAAFLLMKAPSHLEMVDAEKNTPLLAALNQLRLLAMEPLLADQAAKCLECVMFLLDKSADVNKVNLRLESPMHIALQIQNAALVEALRERGAQLPLPLTVGFPTLVICVHCNKPLTDATVLCGRCRRACYCTRECLVADWEQGHHQTCRGQ